MNKHSLDSEVDALCSRGGYGATAEKKQLLNSCRLNTIQLKMVVCPVTLFISTVSWYTLVVHDFSDQQ